MSRENRPRRRSSIVAGGSFWLPVGGSQGIPRVRRTFDHGEAVRQGPSSIRAACGSPPIWRPVRGWDRLRKSNRSQHHVPRCGRAQRHRFALVYATGRKKAFQVSHVQENDRMASARRPSSPPSRPVRPGASPLRLAVRKICRGVQESSTDAADEGPAMSISCTGGHLPGLFGRLYRSRPPGARAAGAAGVARADARPGLRPWPAPGRRRGRMRRHGRAATRTRRGL